MIAVTLRGVSKTFPRAGTVVNAMDLQVRRGEFFTLLGPSGCGKSTLLRIIAGFEEPSTGRVFFDDYDVTDDAPNRRGIGYAFQQYALFPHLTVAENVAFGLRVRKAGPSEITAAVRKALADVMLGDCGSERVDRLSGGQQQRVALARALVLRPRLLLLDEPLSNLDARLRADARALLARIHDSLGCTIVYVTHDQAEAMSMSDRVAVLANGRLHQVAAPEAIYEQPATRFVADFVGRNNVIDGVLSSRGGARPAVRLNDGTELPLPSWRHVTAADSLGDARVSICLRPESLRLTSGYGPLRGVVTTVEYTGATRLCGVQSAVGSIHVEISRSDACPRLGERVSIVVDESALHLIPRESRS